MIQRESAKPLSPGLVWFMAAACGVSVANVYFNQPLLGDFAEYFHVPAWLAGLVATAAQVGYGSGLLFFLPLGDLVERRRLIVGLVNACAACLVVAALAPTIPVLIAAQLLVGVCAISPQILVPLGVDMVPATQRATLIGALMGGLLSGVLLARVVAGFVADHFGWRTVYGVGALLMLGLSIGLQMVLPRGRPAAPMPYGRLMASLGELLRTQPVLRRFSLISALSFGSFSAFWTTLSFLMTDYFHRGAVEAGLFGVVGLIGAAGAPMAGRLSDRRGVGFTISLSLIVSVAAFIVMGWATIAALIVGVLLMDLGVQSLHVAAQARAISLVQGASSRLNTVYMVTRFIGGAAGSACGAVAWTLAKWPGVCVVSLLATLLALVLHFQGTQRKPV